MTPEAFTQLDRLTTERSSCRAFLDRAVPRNEILRVLELAQRTPSWCNCQPWQVVLLSGQQTRDFARAYHDFATRSEGTSDLDFPAAYQGVYQTRRRECGWQLYESVGIGRGDREASARQALENYRFFGAPHLALITSDRSLGSYGAIDCGGYVNAFVLAAQSLGIATVPQAALATHADFVRRSLGLTEDRMVICGIAFGYADTSQPVNRFRTTRAAVDEVVTWLGQAD